LGFAPQAFIFIDDDTVERERVRQRMPEIEVWGDDLFALRRRLLNDPRLQVPQITAESRARTELMRANLQRRTVYINGISEDDFIASLSVETRFEHIAERAMLPRVVELFQRITQFNTTGIKLSVPQLESLLGDNSANVFGAYVKDRFADHGMVGAAVVRNTEILGLVLSCRVLGMGVEHRFLQHLVTMLAADHATISGRIIETPRNAPVRNFYRDNGFSLEQGTWRRVLKGMAAAPEVS
jgi:FkbH-like protein